MANKKSKFELVIGAVNKLSGPFGKIQAAFSALGDRAEKLKRKLHSVGNKTGLPVLLAQVGNVNNRFKNLKNEGSAALGKVTGAVGKLSLAFGVAGGGALALVKATANAGDAAAKSAARAGTSIAVWQEYAHAASLSDVNEQELAKGFRKLQDTAIKAVQGGKTQASLLKMAGINPKNAKGEVKNAESLFLELSDKIQALTAAGKNAEATNLLTGFFGDKGASLMPMLAGGSAALKDLRQEAHDLGLVFSDEDAHASEAFGDSMTRVGQVLQGIANAIGKVLLPFITKLADKLTATAKGAHQVIGSGFAEWINSIDVDQLFNAIDSGLQTLKSFWKTLQAGVKFIGGWGNILKAVAAIILAKVVMALAALSGSFISLGVAIMTTPIGWIMAGIAGLAAAGYLIVKNWDKIKAWWNNTWQDLKEKCGSILDAITGFLAAMNPLPYFQKAWEAVKSFFSGFSLSGETGGIIDGIINILSVFTPIKFFQNAWEAVKNFFSGFSLSDVCSAIIDGAMGALSVFSPLPLFQSAWEGITSFFSGCSLTEAAQKIMDSLLGGLKDRWQKVTGWVKSVGGKIAKFFGFGGDDKALEDSNSGKSTFPMAEPRNLAPTAASIVNESIQKTETVERNEVKIVVSSKDQTPVEAALSGKSGGAVSLDTGKLMGGAV